MATLGVMSTPTLGYIEDTTISKRDIAVLQLNSAVSLFLAQEYVCAITLAGASEAVFAGLLAAQSQPSVVEDSTTAIANIWEKTGLVVAEGKKKTEIYNDWNSIRNKLKHHAKGEDEQFTVNLFDEAYWMIKRALCNAKRLNITIESDIDFENWVIGNINI